MALSDHIPPATRGSGRDPALPSLLGDALCLDFVNTVSDRTGSRPVETLHDFSDLARWFWHVGLIEREGREVLLSSGQQTPAAMATFFATAIDLREAIYRVFAAMIAGQAASSDDLEIITKQHRAALAAARLMQKDDRYVWTWEAVHKAVQTNTKPLEPLLWPIARSAIELLTSDGLTRVKQCPGTGDCGWLFLDVSKNGTRRWCSMEGCGSRAKMRRLYARRKARSSATEDRT